MSSLEKKSFEISITETDLFVDISTDFFTDFSNWISDVTSFANIESNTNQKIETDEKNCNRRIKTRNCVQSIKTNDRKQLIKTSIIVFRLLRIDIIVDFNNVVTLRFRNV